MRRWHRWVLWFVVDVLCLIFAFLPTIIVEDSKPFERVIDCNDRDIQKPKRVSSINVATWMAINFLPAAILGIGELLTDPLRFNQSFYKLATTYMLGAFTSCSMTTLAKFYTGRYRPDFLASCKPKVCEGLMTEVDCDLMDDGIRDVSRLSFYSFHSSHAMYCMVFVVLYVQDRMQGRAWMRLLKPTIQFNLLLLALWVGYTRVFDNKNHLNDVLMGMVQGACSAVFMVRCLSPDVFKLPEDPAEATEHAVSVAS